MPLPPIETYRAFTYATDAAAEAAAVQIVEQSDARKLIGYAVVWGAISETMPDGFRHRFNRGSIRWLPMVHALVHHQWFLPLAVTTNGTLKLTEDGIGARVEITLGDTTAADDALKNVRAGIIRGMSFGGRRTAFTRTAGDIIDVTGFIANEVTITARGRIAEAGVDTAENFSESSGGNQKFRANNRLTQMKLATLAAGVR
ncbi:MAG: HK97 family phage prohead protease [Tepidisphaeraceae bacterium]